MTPATGNFPFSLCLFSENGGSESGGEAAPLPSGESSLPNAQADTGGQSPDREGEFETLISGEYKDLYDRRVSAIVKKRLKERGEEKQKVSQMEGVIATLAGQLGVDPTDLAAMDQALKGSRPSAPPAPVKGVVEELLSQAQQVQSLYPTFQVEQELKNPRFAALMRLPFVDMQTAYELTHKEEILPAVMEATARQVESRIAKSMATTGNRPFENGNTGHSASMGSGRVASLSASQMDDICQRVSRGEKIYLK